MASHVVEVLALRAPPDARRASATVARDAPPASNGVAAFDDSARRLDAAFQAEREAINREAIALRGTDRRTRAYAVAHAELERRIAAAERVRSERDAFRVRSAEHQRERPADDTIRAPLPTGRDSAVRRMLLNGSAMLRLTSGTWWIAGANSDGALVGRAVRHEVRAGERDTVRLGGAR
ncbi:MAG TPA: hypothetical protein VJ596_11200 [Gemmatimonadaceae bacterium]|nr:hypothetical protein [Gemmatimonadaceae bacterium]